MLASASVRMVLLVVLAVVPPPHVEAAIDFDTQIMPLLTKAGCNGGACHGAAAGRGGFHLSLLGADPGADYEAIVHQFEGRRIDLAKPERSLILRKPIGDLDHGGDVALPEDEPAAERLLAWLRAGAARGASRQLTSFEVQTELVADGRVTEGLESKVPLRAVASFDNGPPEDVTAWTTWVSADPSAVAIDEAGLARLMRPGQHVVIARFLDRVVAVPFHVPLSSFSVDLSAAVRNGFIDDEVLAMLVKLRLPVSPPATDAEWLRRVSLDLTGRLPDPNQVLEFLADESEDKRERLVDQLLVSDAFVDIWTLRLAKLLRMHSLGNEPEALRTYHAWLRDSLARRVGLDRIARDLLTATGDSHVVGPANFGRMAPDPRGQAELFGRFFLGARLACANCHNHPLDRWTQDDYHGLAAVFARVDRGRQVRLLPRGEVTNLRTNEPAVPRIPGVRDLVVTTDDPRGELASWLLDEEPHRFARAMVNRLWRSMFGRGLVEPSDDLRETNPATHPELLERLAADFIASGYDLRHTLRRIALSGTYGRGSQAVAGNESDERFYSRAGYRPLEPEVLLDAIVELTGVPEPMPVAGVERAVQLIDPLVPVVALEVLGRCRTLAACDEEQPSGGGLTGELHRLNGELVNAKLASDTGRLAKLLAAGRSDREILGEFYLRGLGQPLTDQEWERWSPRVVASDAGERRQRLEDFVWGLINSRSFRENH